MTIHPYEPPSSNLGVNISKDGSPIKAIIIALIVDYAGTITLSTILGVIYAFILISNGVSPEDLTATMQNGFRSTPFYYVGIVFGLGMTILASYLCARIANKANYRAVNIYLVLMIVIGKVIVFVNGGDVSSPENIILTTISILGGYLGAWYYIRKLQQ